MVNRLPDLDADLISDRVLSGTAITFALHAPTLHGEAWLSQNRKKVVARGADPRAVRKMLRSGLFGCNAVLHKFGIGEIDGPGALSLAMDAVLAWSRRRAASFPRARFDIFLSIQEDLPIDGGSVSVTFAPPPPVAWAKAFDRRFRSSFRNSASVVHLGAKPVLRVRGGKPDGEWLQTGRFRIRASQLRAKLFARLRIRDGSDPYGRQSFTAAQKSRIHRVANRGPGKDLPFDEYAPYLLWEPGQDGDG